ncbi:MAG: choline dehydrogenase [Alphaproteobacteria bacterium]|nr:choline dehydrogenase [Alphaproteobacteria bacterium]
MARCGFDCIVIGAGSAGCVLANRLSADPAVSVLLIEAGGRDWNPLLRVPIMTGLFLRSRLHNWSYRTEPEPELAGRRLAWPRGRVLGGSSAINGMVYTRGTPLDYDSWAQAGLPGWSFDRVLPFFKRAEDHHAGADGLHGAGGPLAVGRPVLESPLGDAFVAAGAAAGFPRTGDFNGPEQEGFGRYDFNIAGGRRRSSASAYLDPARRRPNLTIVTGAQVARIAIESGRARAVELVRRGRTERIEALREIVLCGGTVNSPVLLMHSGIGDPDQLHRHGIAVAAPLTGVGRNLRDHLLVRVSYECRQSITLHNLMRADRAALAVMRALLFGTGPAARFPLEAGAFLKSDPALSQPDLQSHFLPGLSTAALRLPFLAPPSAGQAGAGHGGHGFFANIYPLRPASRGTIELASSDPLAAPHIRPRYLSDPADRALTRRAIRILREIFARAPFDPYRGAEIMPGAAVQTDRDLDAWISHNADTVFHPVGTCRMGTGPDAVVDGELRVHGIAGLRVADASIMPAITSGNTNAPTVMIAEKAAAMMIGE